MKSLDPRIERLPELTVAPLPKAPLDQFGSYEVFVQPKEEKPFQHEGIVHAPDLELAYVFAKENFTRRFTCTSLYVVDTRKVFVSATTDGNQNAYDTVAAESVSGSDTFEIYHLLRRGKQHVAVGTVKAGSPSEAMAEAKKHFGDKLVFNIWAIRQADIRYTTPEERDLWNTLPEKRFRDAADYKGGDKLNNFLAKQSAS
ncbi:MAG TPA: phenylacetic acid degradation b [Cyclobacteriaceae bacterium]|nr:phenylacetic acid degradation b [Cyclobacteriaceae bacterium]HQQ98162.1 phenylacetic acid degradation b [Cyclobacteriaceae bacterium]